MGLDRLAGAALREVGRRTRRGMAAAGALAALLATAFGFLTAALYLALAEAAGAVGACLAVAMLYLLVAVVVYLAARRPEPPVRERPAPEPDAISELIATFLAGVRAGREGFGRNRRP